MTSPIAVYYEHPQWFRPLFGELERRGAPYEGVDASRHSYRTSSVPDWSLVVNRMSPSAWTRGNGRAMFHTADFLAHLADRGVPVLNGAKAFSYELSKARQLSLLTRLGIPHPRATKVNHPSQIVAEAEELQYPVLVKPNVGGSGAGIHSFATPMELETAVGSGALDDLGPDHSALVQEHLPVADESIIRVEVLDGRLLYAIRINLVPGGFNLCPADYCELPGMADGVSGRGSPIEAYHPPAEIVEQAVRIIETAGIEVGGVEYLINRRDGRAYFYDVNALSNFVADAPEVIGFDPFVDLVDYILRRAGIPAPVGA